MTPARVRALALAAAVLALSAAPVLAQENHGGAEPAARAEHAEGAEPAPHIDGKKIALQFLNFAVLAGLLGFFGGRAVNKALLARHEQLKTELKSAAEARKAAEERLKKQEARLESLEVEIAAISAGIKQEAEAEKAALLAAAEERARRIREETKFILDQQVKEAELQLKREVAEEAIKVAEALLRRSLEGRDQQRFLDAFVRDVASGNGAPVAGPPTDGTPAARPTTRSEA